VHIKLQCILSRVTQRKVCRKLLSDLMQYLQVAENLTGVTLCSICTVL
jgi:hypothetical protein